MEKYFNIPYEFDKQVVLEKLDSFVKENRKGYICVADGVTLSMSTNHDGLIKALGGASLITCDSGWVPIFIKWIYGEQKSQYAGTDFFRDVIHLKKYRMMFLGASDDILEALKNNLSGIDPAIGNMSFLSLPFLPEEKFNYPEIAGKINRENPDIVWVSLGMPKQELFMYYLEPYLEKTVLIGIGAAFKFMSGLAGLERAPSWMIRCKIEWVHRIISEPGKQIKRCMLIMRKIPGILYREMKTKKQNNVRQ